jgi:hypothetical protein
MAMLLVATMQVANVAHSLTGQAAATQSQGGDMRQPEAC